MKLLGGRLEQLFFSDVSVSKHNLLTAPPAVSTAPRLHDSLPQHTPRSLPTLTLLTTRGLRSGPPADRTQALLRVLRPRALVVPRRAALHPPVGAWPREQLLGARSLGPAHSRPSPPPRSRRALFWSPFASFCTGGPADRFRDLFIWFLAVLPPLFDRFCFRRLGFVTRVFALCEDGWKRRDLPFPGE